MGPTLWVRMDMKSSSWKALGTWCSLLFARSSQRQALSTAFCAPNCTGHSPPEPNRVGPKAPAHLSTFPRPRLDTTSSNTSLTCQLSLSQPVGLRPRPRFLALILSVVSQGFAVELSPLHRHPSPFNLLLCSFFHPKKGRFGVGL